MHWALDGWGNSGYNGCMYIRKTTIKTKKNGQTYHTYRLVESFRSEKGVRQRTLLNLGKNFPYREKHWPGLANRIQDILYGQKTLFALPAKLEQAAQHYAALLISSDNRQGKRPSFHYNTGLSPGTHRSISVKTEGDQRKLGKAAKHLELTATHNVLNEMQKRRNGAYQKKHSPGAGAAENL